MYADNKAEMDAMFSKGEEPWGQDWRASQFIRYSIYKRIIESKVFTKKAPPIKILDIGCSLGDFTNTLYKMNTKGTTIGVDISEIGIEMAKRKYPHIDFRVSGLPELELDISGFDLITCLESIYYIPMEGRIASLKRIKELLKPDGYLLISVPHWRHHKKYFTKEGFKRFLESEFETLHIEYNYGLFYYFFEIPLFRYYWRLKSVAKNEKWKKRLGASHKLIAPISLWFANTIRFMLSRKTPAKILFALGEKLIPQKSITHSIALCKKKDTELVK